MQEIMSDTLLAEYEMIIASLGKSPTDDKIVAALVKEGAWTEQGALEVIQIARKYGIFILRNACALASAMEIEDGEFCL